MKNKYIFFSVVIALIAIAPQFAFASWWNPFTWHWFQKNTAPAVQQTEVTSTATTTDNQFASTTAAASLASTTSATSSVPATTHARTITTPKTLKQPVSHTAATPIIQNTQTCNGTEWLICPAGQDFVCPATGNAYCLPSSPTQVTTAPQSSNVSNSADTNKELSSKSRSLEIINQIIATENQLNDGTTQQISLANSNLNAIVGRYDTASITFRSLTTLRRDRLQSSQAILQQLINSDQSRKVQLESADLSTYLKFDPDSFFKNDLDKLVQIKAQFDSDNNNYRDAMRSYSSIMGSFSAVSTQTTQESTVMTQNNVQQSISPSSRFLYNPYIVYTHMATPEQTPYPNWNIAIGVGFTGTPFVDIQCVSSDGTFSYDELAQSYPENGVWGLDVQNGLKWGISYTCRFTLTKILSGSVESIQHYGRTGNGNNIQLTDTYKEISFSVPENPVSHQ